ncbi:hypothetical protein [Nocardia terpenica]|uniref:Uncharacterized protein n=1 Tax=Nocardia terpenica TaxID=455432 RepID=A0A161XIC8_9NOCA|nr:hypothetical protein [Nocardia terpenica]KZM73438.1 hypothetical protein AWN90_32920 [Nocardia terpenica]NQE87383.1 hypothetical protein [Nocardia terpenica]
MVFHNISTTAQNSSGTSETAGEGISGYAPKKPTESAPVPPHDPAHPIAQCPQDPRIGCETSPQAQIVFNLVSALFGTIKRATEEQATVSNDPVPTAGPITKNADQTARKVTDDVPRPDGTT